MVSRGRRACLPTACRHPGEERGGLEPPREAPQGPLLPPREGAGRSAGGEREREEREDGCLSPLLPHAPQPSQRQEGAAVLAPRREGQGAGGPCHLWMERWQGEGGRARGRQLGHPRPLAPHAAHPRERRRREALLWKQGLRRGWCRA